MSFTELMFEGVIPLLGMILSFAVVITIILIMTRAKQRRLEMHYELQAKLIDKFGSSAELIAFLQSENGQRFVRGVQSGTVRMARNKAASAVRLGIMFTAIGAGFLFLWPMTDTPGLAWPGVLMLVLGIAFFGTSYVTLRFSDDRPVDTPHFPTSSEG